jgi:alpha-L-fucosidase
MLKDVQARGGSQIELLGEMKPLQWSQKGTDLEVALPASLPGKYAYVLRMEPAS